MSNLPVLARASALVIRQQKELLEVFTDFETKNRYAIQLPDGQTAFYAAETGGGAWAFITRSFLKARRPFTMDLLDPTGGMALRLERPWTWFFSELHVRDAQGQRLGMIDQRFAFLSRRFVILDPTGRELAQIHGPLWRPWTFRILQPDGQEVGRITKKWSGLLVEAFTDADTFGVEMSPGMDARLRPLVLAATFLIDFLYFEDRD
ncbi:phospholipid scramblase-related protein [Paraliomyxa miuraensis]|uniref:phospholipid scramblase-related protein n=1 Tax=Paraliomyxa miuraensis TaxID=376150 RepID=UPI00225488F3|nr:phospholipid scramblase-related protein [Paraliomyxa miuraensis]MCX4243470.1 phospholipid scramblase family protein [Paraliomyxa miuraensis]